METLESNQYQDTEKVLFIKVQSEGGLDSLNADEIQTLSRKFIDKAVVFYIASRNNEKFIIYWKSKGIEEFLILMNNGKVFKDNDKIIYDFIADYLAESLSKGELG